MNKQSVIPVPHEVGAQSTTLIDTHAHLEDRQFDSDRPQVIDRAFSEGLSAIINVGSDLKTSRVSLQLASKYKGIYAAVGIHPHEAAKAGEEVYKSLADLASQPRVAAIGETGLDYYRGGLSPVPTQIKAFRQQIRLAIKIGLPLIIHSREAAQDTLAILEEEGEGKIKGVMHAFSYDGDILKKVLKLGLYISITGVVTFPKSGLPEIIRQIPSERILLETDCPYLTPVPKRGKRNEPSYLKYTARRASEILELSYQDIMRINRVNTCRLFGIGSLPSPVIAYPIRDSLYLNITNRCTNECTFCTRHTNLFVKGHNLRLQTEPTISDILAAVPDPSAYREIVFCGYGEPLLRIEVVIEAARLLKEKGAKRIRVNTNGHGNLIYQRNILPELAGVVDAISISLNTESEGKYLSLCRPQFGQGTYQAVLDFIKETKEHIGQAVVTAVDLPEVDIPNLSKMVQAMGVEFRIRSYNQVG
ncbi:MAG: TatD family nuclease-associated radical SAM protein [bacterium]|nr:TatD family nuclease-associated radical SAM protein [bacterium]